MKHATLNCKSLHINCPMECGVECSMAEMRDHLHVECPRVQTRLRYSYVLNKVYMKTDKECEERVLINLGYMSRTYLSEPAYQTYVNLGKFTYPCPAPDHFNTGSGFSQWTKVS